MTWVKPIEITGKYVSLVPLKLEHCVQLQEAVKDGELWNLPFAIVPTPARMEEEIQRRLELQTQGSMLPFTVIDCRTQNAVGMTTYCWIDSINQRLDIGWTWYRKSAQRTAINTESKLLLLAHAFEQLNAIAVGFRVNTLNEQSRRAVERLGAKLEGIIRNYSRMPNGQLRDMCLYSILPNEWPQIKMNLENKTSILYYN